MISERKKADDRIKVAERKKASERIKVAVDAWVAESSVDDLDAMLGALAAAGIRVHPGFVEDLHTILAPRGPAVRKAKGKVKGNRSKLRAGRKKP